MSIMSKTFQPAWDCQPEADTNPFNPLRQSVDSVCGVTSMTELAEKAIKNTRARRASTNQSLFGRLAILTGNHKASRINGNKFQPLDTDAPSVSDSTKGGAQHGNTQQSIPPTGQRQLRFSLHASG